MSTITKEFTKEQLQQIIETDHVQCGEASALARIALASLEAEPLCYLTWHQGFRAPDDCEEYVVEAKPGDKSCDGTPAFPVYTAPPAPVSVPDAYIRDARGRMILNGKQEPRIGYSAGWNAYRAAMLQGADGTLPNEGTIPVTQFKPVADLYGLTSPTGSETSFTFDAVEARDFIDGGWSCQEYVELGRFQEAVSGNSPVIPDGWVACSERMPEKADEVLCAKEFDGPGDWRQKVGYYLAGKWTVYSASWTPTHWQPLPAAPQQEVK